MTQEDFKEYKLKEGWSDDEEDDEEEHDNLKFSE